MGQITQEQETVKKPRYTLGLDIGNAPVGAALLGEDKILGLHVRTFDRAEIGPFGVPLNLIRRESSSTRKRIRRRSHRLAMFRRFFHRLGVIGSPTNEKTPVAGNQKKHTYQRVKNIRNQKCSSLCSFDFSDSCFCRVIDRGLLEKY